MLKPEIRRKYANVVVLAECIRMKNQLVSLPFFTERSDMAMELGKQ